MCPSWNGSDLLGRSRISKAKMGLAQKKDQCSRQQVRKCQLYLLQAVCLSYCTYALNFPFCSFIFNYFIVLFDRELRLKVLKVYIFCMFCLFLLRTWAVTIHEYVVWSFYYNSKRYKNRKNLLMPKNLVGRGENVAENVGGNKSEPVRFEGHRPYCNNLLPLLLFYHSQS